MRNHVILGVIAGGLGIVAGHAAALGPRGARLVDVQALTSSTVYAEEFGVRCQGSPGDDTEALRAAVRSATGQQHSKAAVPGRARRRSGDIVTLRLPPGDCVLSDTLTIRDAWGFTLEGAGVRTTVIHWAGGAPTNKAMLELLDCRNCKVKNLGIAASSGEGAGVALDTAIRISNDGTTAAVLSSSDHLEDVDINGTHGAIRVGVAIIDGPGEYPRNATNNEFHTLTRVRVANFADYGFQIGGAHTLVEGAPGGANYKGIRFRDAQCACARTGDSCVYQYSGSFEWSGGSASNCTDAAFKVMGTAGADLITGADSESCGRFLYVDGPSGAARGVTVIGTRSETGPSEIAPDGCWFLLGGRGPYNIIGGIHGGLAVPAGICHVPGGSDPKPRSVNVIGTQFRTTLEALEATLYCRSHRCLPMASAPGTLRSNQQRVEPHSFPQAR